MKTEVKIRFNTDFLIDKRWRYTIGEVSDFVDEISIHCKSYTTKDMVKNNEGVSVEKYHITCRPKSVLISRTKFKTKLTLK